ncbi:MAG: hypothetical protein PGMFKBFP_00276 [Anaerolineales bacterium]|nr:hypothetical protein [Anaerolineales bacterium]
MKDEISKLLQEVVDQAPKEFTRTKKTRTLILILVLTVLVVGTATVNWLGESISGFLAVILLLAVVTVLGFWLNMSWRCPVCDEIPGSMLGNPKFCIQCGAKLEE